MLEGAYKMCSYRNKPTISSVHLQTNKYTQSGATLIIVLFMLILIMIIGAIAIRGSVTDLKVSTAAQVNKLLFQSNDAAFMKVEKEDRILGARAGGADTLKIYMTSPKRLGHEVSFCVRPRQDKLFSIFEISELNADGNLLSGYNNGYCDPSNKDDYVSEGRVMTQMTFVRPIVVNTDKVFHQEVEGTFSNDFKKPETTGVGAAECAEFVGYVTSVIPSLAPSGVTETQIADCLKKPRIPQVSTDPTVDSCLAGLGVPYQTQQQVYVNQPVGMNCISGT